MSEEELEKLGLTKGELSTIIAKGLVNTFKDLANAKKGEIINIEEINKLLKEKDQEIERLNNIIKKGITEEMKDELDLILKTNQKQAYRINKAIEYIENYLCSDEYIQSDINSIANAFVKLVDILKGVNKE